MNELKELLNSVEDTYDDFVMGVCHYARKNPERLENVLNLLSRIRKRHRRILFILFRYNRILWKMLHNCYIYSEGQ